MAVLWGVCLSRTYLPVWLQRKQTRLWTSFIFRSIHSASFARANLPIQLQKSRSGVLRTYSAFCLSVILTYRSGCYNFIIFLVTIMPAFKRQDLSDLLPGLDLSQIPSGIPPDGVIPNFVDPENVGYIPRIGIYVLLPLMLAAVLCRIGTRLKLTRTLGLDDGLYIPRRTSDCLSMVEISY